MPAKADIKILENGQYVKYDYSNNVVDFTGAGEWMMVFNEVKLYDDFWRESYKDFAMIRDNYTSGTYVNSEGEEEGVSHDGVGPLAGQMVPRVIKINIGDIYTTNCLEKGNTSGKATVQGTEELSLGDVLSPNAQGYLSKSGDGSIRLEVVKIYTLPDGQQAVKVMRIA